MTPNGTSTSTLSPTATLTETPSPTPSPTSTSTNTPLPPLAVLFSGCNTSLDITHGMGEVTNAYVTLRNYGNTELTNVCATLFASDEDRVHPDKTRCTSSLPALYQIMLKLTVDTGLQEDTSIRVEVVSTQGVTGLASQPSCRDIGFPGWVPAKVDILELIQ
jgi:hypothetical protein